MMVPTLAPWTGAVVIGEIIASVLPSGTRTEAGVWTFGKSGAILTSAPPGGAGIFNTTRAWVELPPETLPGSTTSEKTSRPEGVGGDATTLKLAPADHGPNTSP